MTEAELRALNAEAWATNAFASNAIFSLVFPEPRRIEGVFMYGDVDTGWSLTTSITPAVPVLSFSQNTTNGVDGTWSGEAMFDTNWDTTGDLRDLAQYRAVRPYYRMRPSVTPTEPGIIEVAGASAANVRGIRFRGMPRGFTLSSYANVYVTHLYGRREVTATSDALQFWKAGTDEPLGVFGWGDVPAGSSADLQFRVKNMSSVRTATSVVVATDVVTNASPSVVPQFVFSLDGITWDSSLTFASLAAGATTPVIYVRRATLTNAQIGSWSPRLVADVGAWV
jgi:hypothetical protein